jgi:Tol biopolymer transport system component
MKTKLLLLLVLLLATSISSLAFQNPQNHKVLYEKAKYTMETKADLQEAITLFESLIASYPNEKEYAAKAQFNIGHCYEKLGLKEAQKAYQKVLDNYPEQEQEISLAKERLNRLLALQDVPSKPSFRKIRIPTELSWNLALSPDGQKLLLVSDKKLWVMPLSGNLGTDIPGKPVELNTEGIKVEWTGISWSEDGKWVAFNELPLSDTLLQKDGYQSVYVVPVEGGTPKKVFENYRSARTVNYKLSLSPHGKTLIFSSIENEKQTIQTIPMAGGEPKQLTDMQSREPVFSPDGKLIAFVEDKLLGVSGGGLWVMSASGGHPTLIAEAGKASSPVWSPDGSKIAYVDFSDNKKIFIMPVDQDGKPTGEKITIHAPEEFEEVPLLAGWDPDNKIGALMVSQMEFALYTLPEQGGQAAQVVKGVRPSQPRWTPDGKHIQFLKMAGEESLPPNNTLAVVPAEGGEERDILSGSNDSLLIMGFQSGLRISPDGNRILMAASHWGEIELVNNFPLSQIWTTTSEGDNPIQITTPPVPYTDVSPCWSPDGESIVFVRIKIMEGQMNIFGETGIYTSNSSGKELKLLISDPDKWINSINWSPDGKWIAYLTMKKQAPHESMLNVINMESGESKIVTNVQQASAHTELAWSPDSKRIACNDGEGKKIKIIQLDNGNIEDIETGLVDTNIYHLDWSPDGKRFVFGGWKGGGREFWWVENFLPEIK